MLARDSVINMLVSATKMVKTYLLTSWLEHFRRIEPKKMLHADISFGEHCWTEDLEDDYFEQKIRIKPDLRTLDLQG